MTGKKPLVVITRKLPDLVETRMMELFDTKLNLDDAPKSEAELIEAVNELNAGTFIKQSGANWRG